MFVKICGITNREDAQAAIDAGADALGFIFHPASPRYIAPDLLVSWIAHLPRRIWRVGVFMNESVAHIDLIAHRLALDVVQLHGDEAAENVPSGIRIWKAFRVETHIPASLDDFPCEAVLLDGKASGQTFDWTLARNLRKPVIIAGGLNEDNVQHAIETFQPWGVDASSSLELYPGKKDHARMARFIATCQPSRARNRALTRDATEVACPRSFSV